MDVQALSQRQTLAASGDIAPAMASAAQAGFADALSTVRSSTEPTSSSASAVASHWLTTAEAAQTSKPHPSDFAKAGGISHLDACELLYGVVGSNVERRNWQAIMASPDPVLAARQATREMYGDTSQSLREDAAYLPPEKTLAAEGHFAALQSGTTKRPEVALMLVDAQGLLLRHAGQDEATIARNAWLFGFDTNELETLAPKVQAAAPALAVAMQGAARDPSGARALSALPPEALDPMKMTRAVTPPARSEAPAEAAPALPPESVAVVGAAVEVAMAETPGPSASPPVEPSAEHTPPASPTVVPSTDQWAADAARQVAWVSSSQVLEALFDSSRAQ